MRALQIPSVGDILTLAEPWTFDLHHEYRNETMMEHLGLPAYLYRRDPPPPFQITLAAGTQLRIDRIYIRKGESAGYNSFSFLVIGAKTAKRVETRPWKQVESSRVIAEGVYEYKIPAKPVRFWAKLADVNTMQVTD